MFLQTSNSFPNDKAQRKKEHNVKLGHETLVFNFSERVHTVAFPIDNYYSVLAPTLKIYPTMLFYFTAHDRPTKTPGV